MPDRQRLASELPSYDAETTVERPSRIGNGPENPPCYGRLPKGCAPGDKCGGWLAAQANQTPQVLLQLLQ